MSKPSLEDLVKECYSWSELYRKHNSCGTPNTRTLKKFIKDNSHLDVKHFDRHHSTRKYVDVLKVCPSCNLEFKTKSGGSAARVTCSYACSNSHFRSGEDHGNWNQDAYRTTCFHYHRKECVVCGEDKIVEVHHLDEDHKNNHKNNLIPLCPTHHRYWHSRYKYLVEDVVLDYIKDFIKNSH